MYKSFTYNVNPRVSYFSGDLEDILRRSQMSFSRSSRSLTMEDFLGEAPEKKVNTVTIEISKGANFDEALRNSFSEEPKVIRKISWISASPSDSSEVVQKSKKKNKPRKKRSKHDHVLIKAFRHNDDEFLRKTFDNNPSMMKLINQSGWKNTSPLKEACKSEADPFFVSELLERGADVHYRDSKGNTPLQFAAQTGQAEKVKLLLSNNAWANTYSSSGITPLHRACMYGHFECVKILLQNGANVNAKNKYGFTALMYAAELGHNDIVNRLLLKGAKLNTVTPQGETAIMKAAKNENIQGVEMLAYNWQTMNGSELSCVGVKGMSPWSSFQNEEILHKMLNLATKQELKISLKHLEQNLEVKILKKLDDRIEKQQALEADFFDYFPSY